MDAVGPEPAATPAPRNRVVIPHRASWHQRLVAALIYGLIRCISATIRFEVEDGSGLFDNTAPKGRFIFAIWHNRLALSLMLYRRYVQRFDPSRRMAAMVSASRDGGMLARILELFQVEPVRGSSSRRGARALREFHMFAERGLDLAITPDGPRGPCYQVQEGVILAAQLTGLAIVPTSCHLNWKIRLKSWDRFQIPLPFALCRVKTARVIHVPRELSDEDRAVLRDQLESTMRRITVD